MTRKILVAKETGFCFGVRRAIQMLQQASKENKRIQTLGALVHNEAVLSNLHARGIDIVNNLQEINAPVAAIGAHGVSPEIEAELRSRNVEVIDTTCPDVKRAQEIAKKLAEEGYFIVVFGDADHPEVKGILGYTRGRGMAALEIKTLDSLQPLPRRLGILSQTTQIPDNYVQFVKSIIDKSLTNGADIRIHNTICPSVGKRQDEAFRLAQKVDLMLIVGSRTSANTKRLYDICASLVETHLIGSLKELDPVWLKDKSIIGITSGTSASQETIDELVKYLESQE